MRSNRASNDGRSSTAGNVAEPGASSPAHEQKPGDLQPGAIDSVFAIRHPAPEQKHTAESNDAKSQEKQNEDQADEDQDAANKRTSDAAEQAPSPAQENGASSQTSKASQGLTSPHQDPAFSVQRLCHLTLGLIGSRATISIDSLQ